MAKERKVSQDPSPNSYKSGKARITRVDIGPEKRNQMLTVRLTWSERQLLQRRAGKLSLAEFIRKKLGLSRKEKALVK